MNWQSDAQSETAALLIPPPIVLPHEPAPQYPGRAFNTNNWAHRFSPAEPALEDIQTSSPEAIIARIQAEAYTQALCLIISWGTMWRSQQYIYRQHDNEFIRQAIMDAVLYVAADQSIPRAWHRLTGNQEESPRWTPVIASKVLHFIARALGHVEDPPTPIDNKIILQHLWPKWIANVPFDQRPQSWKGRSFEAYNRYMTVIRTWACLQGWTTTQMESTIFASYRNQSFVAKLKQR